MPNKVLALVGLGIMIIAFLACLIMMGLEGYVCGLMILPIVLPLIFLGAVVVHLAKRYDKITSTEKLPVLLLPLFIFIFGSPIEKMLVVEKEKTMEVKSVIEFRTQTCRCTMQ